MGGMGALAAFKAFSRHRKKKGLDADPLPTSPGAALTVS